MDKFIKLHIFSILFFLSANSKGQEPIRLNLTQEDTVSVFLENYQIDETDYKIELFKLQEHIKIDFYEKKLFFQVRKGLPENDSLIAEEILTVYNSGGDKEYVNKKYESHLSKGLFTTEYKYILLKSIQTENLDLIILNPLAAEIKVRDLPVNKIEVKGKSFTKSFSYYDLLDLSFVEFYSSIHISD